jgi:putative polyhydroxyalkanoate system protein
MADISIVQEHALTPQQAHAAAQQVAVKLAADYDLACAWSGDVLRFSRSGVTGTLTLAPRLARMDIKLGFLMSAFAATIESKVGEKMKRVFSAA